MSNYGGALGPCGLRLPSDHPGKPAGPLDRRAASGATGLRSGRAPAREVAGRVPLWIPFVLLMIAAVWLGRSLGSKASARGVASVDTTRYALHSSGRWVSDAWRARIEAVLWEHDALEVLDQNQLESLRIALAGLSFVAETGPLEVVWPDGLSLSLRLREPVACVRIGGQFYPVAADATVLDGPRSSPHEAFGAWLPVIGPIDAAMNRLAVGDVLDEEPHLRALDVAISMWNRLRSETFFEMGRVVIDASHDTAPDGLPGGVYIDLEERRRILLGRPPLAGEPGELPYDHKWSNVERGMDELRAGATWDLYDARWDTPRALQRQLDSDEE